jgi:hypothetical protein
MARGAGGCDRRRAGELARLLADRTVMGDTEEDRQEDEKAVGPLWGDTESLCSVLRRSQRKFPVPEMCAARK